MNQASNDREGPVHSFLAPEAVRLDLPVSGPAPRMLAYGIDLLIMIALSVFLFVIVTMTLPIGAAIDKWIGGVFREALQNARTAAKHPGSAGRFQGLTIAIFLLIEFTVSTGYFIFWEMVTGGRSPGKLLVGLRVVRRNGLPIDLRDARYLIFRLPSATSAAGGGKTVLDTERPAASTPYSNVPLKEERLEAAPDERQLVPPRYRDLIQ